MTAEIQLLIMAAISVAALHTITGPDHYLPFIALSKSRNWTLGKTIWWTTICGAGHVLSSVVLGLGGAALGWSFSKIGWMENIRGGIAGWVMLFFGALYGTWGLYRAFKNNVHKHFEKGDNGTLYVYEHRHTGPVPPGERYAVTPWVMFIIFILGPCEPMIPLLFFPAVQNNWWGLVALVMIYTMITLLMMVIMVALGYYGTAFFRTEKIHRWIHALGGLTISICGAGMLWMGW